uniref:Putative regulation of transcription n=1 Tax=Ixodes ricinus TaxID=34613 RepID=A0A6B0UIU4_IXORI
MHIDDFSGVPASLHMEGAMAKTCAVKKELDDVLGVPYGEDAYCLSPSRNHLEQGATSFIVIKKMPEEILPTPTGSSFHSKDRSRLSSLRPNSKGHRNDACVLKKEQLEF